MKASKGRSEANLNLESRTTIIHLILPVLNLQQPFTVTKNSLNTWLEKRKALLVLIKEHLRVPACTRELQVLDSDFPRPAVMMFVFHGGTGRAEGWDWLLCSTQETPKGTPATAKVQSAAAAAALLHSISSRVRWREPQDVLYCQGACEEHLQLGRMEKLSLTLSVWGI